ncbi:MerR family transcriptional regulator [Streptomyces sparsus]
MGTSDEQTGEHPGAPLCGRDTRHPRQPPETPDGNDGTTGHRPGSEASDVAEAPETAETAEAGGGPDEGADDGREYRAAELAAAAGITTRTLRFYRERRLLPPPRRSGRVAWYNNHHLARVRTISSLLARGHTLGGIADLLTAFEKGRDSRNAAELLGLGEALTPSFSEEEPVRLTPEALAAYFPGDDSAENLSTSLELGYLAVRGDDLVHVSRRLLEASSTLVQQGIPLAAVLDAGRDVRTHVEAIATVFAELVSTHLLASDRDPEVIAAAVERLRPYTKQVVDAELSMALDRKVRTGLDAWLREQRATRPPSLGTPAGPTPPDPTTPEAEGP